MSPIRVLTFSLLLAGLTSAQAKSAESRPTKRDDGVGAVKPPAATETQKTEQEKLDVAIDSTKLLEKSRQVAAREHAFLEQVVKNGGLLRRFKEVRGLGREMTAKFTPEMAGPAMPARTKARLLGDGEKAKLGEDVIFTVESVPVTQKEYDTTVAYLRSYPRANSVASVETLAIAALVERKAGQGLHPQKTKIAHQIITEIRKRVEQGQKFADLAGQYSEDKATANLGGKTRFLVRGEMDKSYAMATQGLKISQCSGIAEAIDGFHLIRMLGIKKGATPDKDQIQTAHIVRYYTNDAASRAQTRARIAAGKIDLAFRTDEIRALAPAQFK